MPPAGATPPGHYAYGEQPYGRYAPHLYGQPGFGPPGFGVRDPNARPATVLAAGIVTIVSCGLVLLMQGFFLIVAAGGARDSRPGRGPVLRRQHARTAWLSECIAGGARVVRRGDRPGGLRAAPVQRGPDRAGGVVGVTVAACLLASISGAFPSILVLLAAIAVIVLLFTGGAGEWYRGRHDVEPAGPPY